MIDYKNYDLNSDDIDFIKELEKSCIIEQNEITLECRGNQFVLEPQGKKLEIYAYGKVIGTYTCFEDFLLQYKIDDKPIIELINEIDYAE